MGRVFNTVSADKVTLLDKVDRETVRKEEADWFKADSIVPQRQHLGKRRFKIKSLSFSDTGKWRLEGDEGTIWTRIVDRDFLVEIDGNRKRFAKDDVLVCELYMIETDDGELEHEIQDVVHESARETAQQKRLF